MALAQGPLGQSQKEICYYLDHSTADVHVKGHACNFKTVGVVRLPRPKMPTILFIYRLVENARKFRESAPKQILIQILTSSLSMSNFTAPIEDFLAQK